MNVRSTRAGRYVQQPTGYRAFIPNPLPPDPAVVTRHFYKPQPLRTLEETSADILAIEKEAEGLFAGIIGRKKR